MDQETQRLIEELQIADAVDQSWLQVAEQMEMDSLLVASQNPAASVLPPSPKPEVKEEKIVTGEQTVAGAAALPRTIKSKTECAADPPRPRTSQLRLVQPKLEPLPQEPDECVLWPLPNIAVVVDVVDRMQPSCSSVRRLACHVSLSACIF